MVIYPGDWEVKRLGDIGTFIKGAPFSKADISTSGTPMILYGELYTTYKEVAYKVQRHTQRKAKAQYYSNVGDVIIPASGETAEEISKATCVMIPGVILAGDLHIYRTDKLDGRFLSYVINHVINRQISEIAQGISIIHISARELAKIPVYYPPLKEQTAIAETLAAFDTHITNLTELITKKKAIRDGALDDLMSGRTRLYGFCGDWEVKTLGECGKFVSGNGFPLKHQGQRKGAYPFYKVSDFSNEGNENYMFRANNYISDDVAKKLSCNIIPAASVIFAKIGAAIFLERKRITTCDCCIDNNMMSFQPSQNISSRFIWYLMQKLKFGDYVQTTALPSLSGKILADILIPLPTLDEQIAIADTLSALDKEISSLETERAKISNIRDGAINDLLTGKVRLKIGI